MEIQLTPKQLSEAFEEFLKDGPHGFIASEVAKHLTPKKIIEPISVQDVLDSIPEDDILAYVKDAKIIDDNVALSFRGGKTIIHDSMIEKIQECLDRFIDPNKMIEKLEELCK